MVYIPMSFIFSLYVFPVTSNSNELLIELILRVSLVTQR